MNLHLGHLLAQRAELTPHREAFVASDGRWTWAEFEQRCRAFSAWLIAQGVQEGDRVAILARNSEFLVNALFAVARTGAIAVVMNWRLQPAELEYILGDSDPVGLLYEDVFEAVAQDLQATRSLRFSLCRGGARDGYAAAIATSIEGVEVTRGPGGKACAAIMYTSGTTGRPKGAMLPHEALVWTAQANAASLVWHHDHRFLLVAPLFHIGGLSPLITNVLTGCSTVLLPEFDPVKVWQVIAEERITTMMCVPLMLQALLMVAQKMPVDASSLVSVTCGASPVPVELIEAARAKGIFVQQVYGITEFCGATCFWTREMGIEHAHTQGKPAMFCEVKVVDPITLQSLPGGEDGELWCRGPMCFSGYWRNQSATQAALHAGWYRSGDIARIDAQGFVVIVDRLKDLIISGGENIYPAELEAVIASLPGVAEVAVIGRADDRWGEVPVACVVRRPEAAIGVADVVQICREKLAGYKCVKAVEFVEALPRNPVGKVLKQELRRRGSA